MVASENGVQYTQSRSPVPLQPFNHFPKGKPPGDDPLWIFFCAKKPGPTLGAETVGNLYWLMNCFGVYTTKEFSGL